ncbi:MAG: DNA polymerase/3'-5' exonuclease PolX [Elusimicrobia bacterium]|nr:DNA polymerase/3'-5' exonuclease PolX [Elusimicrobiota bacterium]
MKNSEVAEKLMEIAHLLEIKGENPFKIRSYEKAANSILSLPKEIKEFVKEDKLKSISGIGASISQKIKELLETGKIQYLENLKKEIPQGLLEMLNIPGMGPKKIKAVYTKFGIKDIRGLEIAARRGDLAELDGFGEKTAQNILRGIELLTRQSGRMLSVTAKKIAEDFVEFLRKEKTCKKIEVCGSLRRACETIGDIDILAVSSKPQEFMERFIKKDGIKKVIAKGETKSSVLTEDEAQVDLRVVEEKSFGAAVMYFTGSKKHNIHLREIAVKKGFTLNEYGLFKKTKKGTGSFLAGKTEEEIYKKLKMQYIPPEIREDTGEIELALQRKLPELVERKDIKGDTHIHSTYSDGNARIPEIAQKAKSLGYEWVGICDHSRSLKVARGLSIEELLKKKKEIENFNKKSDVKVLFGAEVDILPDGTLDYPDEILRQLDICIIAVHTAFNQPEDVLNKRILMAMENPYVHILAHPSCRLIGKREPLSIDYEKIIKKAKERGVILEVNVFPDRLDLKDIYIKFAIQNGVLISMGTDAHALYQMDNIDYGIKYIRRGWVKKSDIINTMTYDEVKKFLKGRNR